MDALRILENYVGMSLRSQRFTETVKLSQNVGKLANGPIICVISIHAECVLDFAQSLGSTVSIIPPELVTTDRKNQVMIPLGPLGNYFTKAVITYDAGFNKLPIPLEPVLAEITSLLNRGDMHEYSSMNLLTERSRSLIQGFKLFFYKGR